LFTASGYHACRALEAVIEDYYRLFCRTEGAKKSWWEYIDALEKMAASAPEGEPRPQPRTMVYLSQTKDAFRNGLMHPRYVLNDLEAETFFTSVKVAMTAMALEMKAAGAPQPSSNASLIAKIFEDSPLTSSGAATAIAKK
jgi:hypothetical protein